MTFERYITYIYMIIFCVSKPFRRWWNPNWAGIYSMRYCSCWMHYHPKVTGATQIFIQTLPWQMPRHVYLNIYIYIEIKTCIYIQAFEAAVQNAFKADVAITQGKQSPLNGPLEFIGIDQVFLAPGSIYIYIHVIDIFVWMILCIVGRYFSIGQSRIIIANPLASMMFPLYG